MCMLSEPPTHYSCSGGVAQCLGGVLASTHPLCILAIEQGNEGEGRVFLHHPWLLMLEGGGRQGGCSFFSLYINHSNGSK